MLIRICIVGLVTDSDGQPIEAASIVVDGIDHNILTTKPWRVLAFVTARNLLYSRRSMGVSTLQIYNTILFIKVCISSLRSNYVVR